MSKKKTHEEFIRDLKIRNENNIIPLGYYKGMAEKIEVKCGDCNHQWFVKPNNLLSGNSGCPNCKGNFATNQKSREKIAEKIRQLGEGFLILEQFINHKTPIEIKCLNCNHVNEVEASNFLKSKKYPCRYCDFKNNEITKYNFEEKIRNRHGDKLVSLTSYVDANTKVTMRCHKHGVVEMLPSNVVRCEGCIECKFDIKRKTLKIFKREVLLLKGDEYEVTGIYIKSSSPIEIKHNVCGHVWKPYANSFLRGSGCPECSYSKGEQQIKEILNNFEMQWDGQHSFNELRGANKKKLSFDFIINRGILVEYDGESHFYPIDFAGRGLEWATEKFIGGKRRDCIKNQYCIDNSIPLIRIPYWEFNSIESILENTLIHFGIIESNSNYDNSKVLEYLVDENWNHDEYIAKCPKNIKERDESNLIAI